MKPRFVLLYTHDRNFDRVLSKALFGTDAIVLTARSVGGARVCLNKPVRAARLANTIPDLNAPHHQPVAA
jgi:hypothetical protein